MWDKEKAIAYLNKNAQPASVGHCAEYTRKAIEAGGVVLERRVSAKDYGQSLQSIGFLPIGRAASGYEQADVVIIEGFIGHPHGHMAMFNGSLWVSDFKQQDIYPGASYKKAQPGYTIYRYSIRTDV